MVDGGIYNSGLMRRFPVAEPHQQPLTENNRFRDKPADKVCV